MFKTIELDKEMSSINEHKYTNENYSFNDFLKARLEDALEDPTIAIEIMKSCGIINNEEKITKDFGGEG